MCGLAGFLDLSQGHGEAEMARICRAMADSLHTRGPDDGGVWCDPAAGIALGFRRLSIIDLSPLGHQPMISANGRYVLTYNGEVYNFQALRAELEADGVTFRGHSDSEVILEGFARWGLEATVRRMIGMFAVALWDRQARVLHLVRDRLGIKPLYWGRQGDLYLFGSELKAFRQHPGFEPEIDRHSLASYLRFAYVPTPHAIYRGVRKLQPGTILTLAEGREPSEQAYWSMAEVVRQGRAEPLDIGDEEALDRLDGLLRDAVGRRMVADVPLGAFLSGGIDSSSVVAAMQAQSNRPVRSFSIGFHEADFDEAVHAKAVARHLDTDHTELYVEPEHARAVIPKLPQIYDEPFADSSQIPTFLVSELARRHVTVSLSGDGGDELFAGYNRYVLASQIWGRVGWAPKALRCGFARSLRLLSPEAWGRLFALVPEGRRPAQAGDKVHKLSCVLEGSADDLYRRLVSQWDQPERLVPGAAEHRGVLFNGHAECLLPDQLGRMLYLDSITYLPDDILTKVDRASMAVSLEARVPLLDHRIVEFVWRLPERFKLREGQSKWLLRQLLCRTVPRTLIDRPKMGFGVPIDSWLRGPLRDWAETMLDEKRLREEGLLNPQPIRQRWDEHRSGHRNWHYPIWTVLMFQAWLEENPGIS